MKINLPLKIVLNKCTITSCLSILLKTTVASCFSVCVYVWAAIKDLQLAWDKEPQTQKGNQKVDKRRLTKYFVLVLIFLWDFFDSDVE